MAWMYLFIAGIIGLKSLFALKPTKKQSLQRACPHSLDKIAQPEIAGTAAIHC